MDNKDEVIYPAESTIGDQYLREPSPGAWEPRRGLRTDDLRRRISAAAYELYLRRGKRRGHALEDWLEAEALLLSQSVDRSGETTKVSQPHGHRRDEPVRMRIAAKAQLSQGVGDHFHKIC